MTTIHSDKNILHIDLETFSSVDLADCGVYKYAESPDFEILLFGYAFNEEPVRVLEHINQNNLPKHLRDALLDKNTIKVAHNAQFERVCLSQISGISPAFLPPNQWQDTMIMATEHGYPPSLAQLGKALGLPEDKQKLATGKRLIQYFCKPVKPTKANNQRTRNLEEHDRTKWALFKEYNQRDVETEREIYNKLQKLGGVDGHEWTNWYVDQRINDRGIGIDTQLVNAILEHGQLNTLRLTDESQQLTGLENTNSLQQLRGWIIQQENRDIQSLNKEAVKELLNSDITPQTRRVLEIRQELGKTSVKKYDAFKRSTCKDGRVHGCFQFYGSRTGRFAGRLIQPQNFPRNSFDDFDDARRYVKAYDWDAVAILWDSFNEVAATLIRTAIVPTPGNTFFVADYSAIEARVIAWLAREAWRQQTFKEGGDIYCASASQMFGVPVVKHGENGHLRQKGKIAELALGYGGGVGALKAMGGEKMGLTEEEMNDIVAKWRKASPHIKQLWATLDKAFTQATRGAAVQLDRGLGMFRKNGNVYIQLPNGRCIAYVQPQITEEGITYMGLNQTTRQWERIGTWGGKLTENVVQAIARDCLCESLERLDKANMNPVMHVHDEIICDIYAADTVDKERKLRKLKALMGVSPKWAQDLVLTADGFYSDYYKKD